MIELRRPENGQYVSQSGLRNTTLCLIAVTSSIGMVFNRASRFSATSGGMAAVTRVSLTTWKPASTCAAVISGARSRFMFSGAVGSPRKASGP